MDLLSKADVLEYYDATVSSVSAEFFLPAVMRARTYLSGRKVGRLGRVTLNRRNILLRDNFSCQYCGRRGSSGLTLDHVIPQVHTWTMTRCDFILSFSLDAMRLIFFTTPYIMIHRLMKWNVWVQSKGGKNSWSNLVTACSSCNSRKGDQTLKQLKWKLTKEPKEPSPWELNLVLAALGAEKRSQVRECRRAISTFGCFPK